jgi:hypothetical protein
MASVETRLAAIETIVVRLDKHLIGEDGNGGLIQVLREADEANKREIAARHEENQKSIQKLRDRMNIIWGAAMALYGVLSFLTGNGFASLEHVLKVVKP